jgi:hypothetical protein
LDSTGSSKPVKLKRLLIFLLNFGFQSPIFLDSTIQPFEEEIKRRSALIIDGFGGCRYTLNKIKQLKKL